MTIATLIKFLRSIGFGGIVGIATFCLIFFYCSAVISIYLNIWEFMAIGAALGSAVQKTLNNLFLKIIYPVGSFYIYYSKLAQLEISYKNGLISKEIHEQIRNSLQLEFFLNNKNKNEELTGAEPKKSIHKHLEQ